MLAAFAHLPGLNFFGHCRCQHFYCPSPSRRWSSTALHWVQELRTFSISTPRPSGQVVECFFWIWLHKCLQVTLFTRFSPQRGSAFSRTSVGWGKIQSLLIVYSLPFNFAFYSYCLFLPLLLPLFLQFIPTVLYWFRSKTNPCSSFIRTETHIHESIRLMALEYPYWTHIYESISLMALEYPGSMSTTHWQWVIVELYSYLSIFKTHIYE